MDTDRPGGADSLLNFTPGELMVASAAREINDGEVVFVGMRLPLLGFQLAKETHAPNAVGVYELGIIREQPAPSPILTMGDLPNLFHSSWLAEMMGVMGLMQRGAVDLGFIGGAQVDRFGNLNTTYIGGALKVRTRLPGSGGACDIASLAKRHIIIMTHEKRRFVPEVDYVTSPGHGDGHDWRDRIGLPGGGPAAIITTMGVLRPDPRSREMVLASIHPSVSIDQVRDKTGWPLRLSPHLSETPLPTKEELTILRRFDPEGYWTRR